MADVDWAGFTQIQRQNQNIPTQNFAQGFQIGALMRQQNALNQAREQEVIQKKQLMDRQALLQSSLSRISAMQDPNEKVLALTDLGLQFPEMSKNLNEASKTYSENAKTTAKNTLMPILSAIKNGRYDLAKSMTETASEAFKNSGNTKASNALRDVSMRIENGEDLGGLFNEASLYVSSILGWDETMAALKAGAETARSDEQAKQEVSTTAIKAEEAKRAPIETQIKQAELDQKPIELATKQAEQTIKQTEAANAPIMAKLDIQEKRANIDLTNQQKSNAILTAKKINSELEKLTKQVNNGVIDIDDPEKRFKFEMDIRNQYQKEAGDFFKVRDAYDRMDAIYGTYLKPGKDGKITIPKGETRDQAQARQAAGDIGLIFNYMKMLDPGSTVREGEFATAASATGVDGKTLNLYNKLISGERLTPEQRGAYFNQAKVLYKKSESRADDVKGNLESYAKNYGLNVNNIFKAKKGTVGRIE